MSDDKMKQIKALAREILVLCEDIPAEVKPQISPRKEGTSFKLITTDTKDFDLQDITVSKVFEQKSGTSKSGVAWSKQSIMVKDAYGQEREMIAWGDTMDKFDDLTEGTRIDVYTIKGVTEYKGKHQYTIGSQTDIRIVESAGGNHVL